MVKEVRKEVIAILLALIAIICLAVFVPAAITIGDPFLNIIEVYGPGQIIQGTATFSLDNEPGDTLVKGQIGSDSVSIKLKELLDESGVSYTCDPINCLEIFNLNNADTSKDIIFSQDQGYSALRTSGQQVTIESLEFSIEGTSSGSTICAETPLKLDLLDDGIIDWEYKEGGSWCDTVKGKNYNPNQATEENLIGSTPYCEQIEIKKTGKITITAEVKLNDGTPGDDDLIFSIYDSSDLLGQCSPGKVENIDYVSRSCEIFGPDFYIQEKKDHFICVKNSGSAEYSIKSESESPFSGFYGSPPSNEFTKDYAINVLIAGFAPFNGKVVFNSSNYLGSGLAGYIQNFINSRYDADCTDTGGCGIPIKIIRTESSQTVNLKELEFRFENTAGPSPSNSFYDLNIEYPLITMDEKSVNIDSLNITVPQNYGTYTFSFSLGTESESADFEVAQVPIIESLSPLSAVPGTEIIFSIIASSPKGNNIISYNWDFGDGTSQQTTTIPEVSHIYTSTGIFNFVVNAVDSESLVGTRTFAINIIVTKEGLNNSIMNKKDKISSFMINLVEWYSNIIREKLYLNTTEETLDNLYSQLETATEQELLNIKNQIDLLEIPQSLDDSLIFQESEYIPSPSIIRPDLVENLGGGSYNSNLQNDYVAGIINWFNNQDITTEGAIKTVTFDDGTSQDIITLTIIDVSLAQTEQVFLIINLPIGVDFQDVSFKEDYSEQEIEDSIAIIIEDSKTIEFVMPGGQQISNIELFLSPNLDTLGVQEDGGIGGTKVPWFWAIFFIIIIILGVLATLYFIWRGKKAKTKIKKQLFRNPMDLFNLTNFIKTATAKGTQKKEIEEKLLKAGWLKKQIEFAFSKA